MLLNYLCDFVGLFRVSMTHTVFEKNRTVEEEVSHIKPASTVPSTMGQKARSPSLPVVNLKAESR